MLDQIATYSVSRIYIFIKKKNTTEQKNKEIYGRKGKKKYGD